MSNQQESSDDVAVDVLIVGAGPAGYMAGVTLARYGVSFRLIDQRPECIQSGQAGGGFQVTHYCILSSIHLLWERGRTTRWSRTLGHLYSTC